MNISLGLCSLVFNTMQILCKFVLEIVKTKGCCLPTYFVGRQAIPTYQPTSLVGWQVRSFACWLLLWSNSYKVTPAYACWFLPTGKNFAYADDTLQLLPVGVVSICESYAGDANRLRSLPAYAGNIATLQLLPVGFYFVAIAPKQQPIGKNSKATAPLKVKTTYQPTSLVGWGCDLCRHTPVGYACICLLVFTNR